MVRGRVQDRIIRKRAGHNVEPLEERKGIAKANDSKRVVHFNGSVSLDF